MNFFKRIGDFSAGFKQKEEVKDAEKYPASVDDKTIKIFKYKD